MCLHVGGWVDMGGLVDVSEWVGGCGWVSGCYLSTLLQSADILA